MKGFLKLIDSSTFILIVIVMAVTAVVAYYTDFTWTAWVNQLNMYITGYVLKESVRYGAEAYKNKGIPPVPDND